MLIQSQDAHHSWGAIGVSENVIEASWQATDLLIMRSGDPRLHSPRCLKREPVPISLILRTGRDLAGRALEMMGSRAILATG
ncbi:MAG: hypothetical protein HYZ92_02565 [Candidatus Omnitrophica bacterium]|nr:hypothetical protein [Candidatus Omnitrophota bacterium]